MRLLDFLLAITVAVAAPYAAQAAMAYGGVAGAVLTVDGAPIARALVQLETRSRHYRAFSSQTGAFQFTDLREGTYLIEVAAPGFAPLDDHPIDVSRGNTTYLTAHLLPARSSLVTLGRITTYAGEALSTSSAPTQELNAQRYASQGFTSIANMLAQDAMSAMVSHPVGAALAAPGVVALRGPDPTETLVELDGHSINSGDSGAFDLSLLDPAEFSDVQLIYGIAPSSLIGPNTIGGAINLQTLEPTVIAHGLARLSWGAFGTSGETLQATGGARALGYALSLHRTTSEGEINNRGIPAVDGTTPTVGSAIFGSDVLAKMRYALARGAGFVKLTLLDEALYRDLSAALTTQLAADASQPATFNSFAGSSQFAHNAAYGLDVELPIGRADTTGLTRTTLAIRHLTSVVDQSVFGPAAGTTPYLNNDRDSMHDEIIEVDHLLPKGILSAKFDLRSEMLDTQQIIAATPEQSVGRHLFNLSAGTPASQISPLAGLAQTERSAVLRFAVDPSVQLHYAIAVYYSDFSSFGTSVDPRIGFVWTPSAQTALRFSLGSTFQSPQLPELYLLPQLPPPDSNGFIDIGNPNLKADHATDYDVGLEHIFPSALPARASLDLYRANLRAPAQRYVPAPNCLPSIQPAPPQAACESFPINAGDAVYQGVEARLDRNLSQRAVLHVAASLNSAYLKSVSAAFQTGSLVVGEQFQGVPLRTVNVSLDSQVAKGVSYEIGTHYESTNNALNRPAFATLYADVTWRVKAVDVGLHGTNLTNVYANGFTLAGQGIPYAGLTSPIATNAYSLPGRTLTLSVTRRY